MGMTLAKRTVKEQTTGLAPPSKRSTSPTRAYGAAGAEHVSASDEDLQRDLGNSFLQSLASNGLPGESPPLIQRQCHCGGTCTACTGKVSMPEGQKVTGPGHALPEATRAFFEAHLGYDFSQVRVHTDGQAATSAEALRASSYTVGQDIVFGAGQFSPHTAQGQRILGHELTHVVQQGRRASSPNRLVSSPGDAAEVEAEHVATSLLTPASENPVVVGVSAQPAATVQRQAWPGEEFSPTAPSGFGLGAARPSPLRFAFGLRAGQPVTEGPLIEWAFEQAEQGVTFANLVRRVEASHEFTGGSPEEKQRWIKVLQGWEPELSAYRDQRELERWEAWALQGVKAAPKGANLVLPQEVEKWQNEPINWQALINYNRLSPIALPNREFDDGGAARHVLYADNYTVVFIRNGYVYQQGQQEFMQQAGVHATFIAKVYQKTQHLPGLYRLAVELGLNFVPLGPVGKVVGFVVKKGVGLAKKGTAAVRAVRGGRSARAAAGTRSAAGAPTTAARVRPPSRTSTPTPPPRQGTTTAAQQSDEAANLGRQAEAEEIVGTASGNRRWGRRLEDVNPRLAEGARRAMQSPQFRRAREELQPLLNQINPCEGRKNCVPTTIAVDRSLATGKVSQAPVTIEETGFRMVQTEKGRVMVKTFEEVGSNLSHVKAYVGPKLNSGASALSQNLRQAGHGARAIVVDSTLSRVSHAYNVINWRGMLIAIDGQTRAMVPFSALLIRLQRTRKNGVTQMVSDQLGRIGNTSQRITRESQ